jgi:hypothetical protein
MTIQTKYNIGDFIEIEGERCEILSVHLYESPYVHTERYYLGNQTWVTLKFERSQNEKNH